MREDTERTMLKFYVSSDLIFSKTAGVILEWIYFIF
jgi:hypothetical protein